MTNGHDFDATYAEERRRAALAALELETRALNAERALEHLRDEVASLRAVALGTPDASWQDDRIVDLETQLEAERDRRIEAEREPEHAGCVPLADVQQLLARCEARYAEGATASDMLDLLAWFVVARAAAAKRGRPNWQCSGCGWGFDGAWRKTCPCCEREDYWTGSVFPGALRWDGSRGTSVPHRGPEPAEGSETGGE